MKWLGADKVTGRFLFVPHMIGCVLLVYAAGTAVDAIRAWIFKKVRIGRNDSEGLSGTGCSGYD